MLLRAHQFGFYTSHDAPRINWAGKAKSEECWAGTMTEPQGGFTCLW